LLSEARVAMSAISSLMLRSAEAASKGEAPVRSAISETTSPILRVAPRVSPTEAQKAPCARSIVDCGRPSLSPIC
jgi:hypothetical protein